MIKQTRYKSSFLLAGLLLCNGFAVAQEPVGSEGVIKKELAEAKAWTLIDHRSKPHSADEYEGHVHVVAFLGTECPLAKLYAGRLQQLQKDFDDRGVKFVAIDSNEQDSLNDMMAFANRQQLTIPFLKDPDGSAARMYGATRTPEVFLVDAAGQVQYSGRIDDQYVIGNVRQAPTVEDLKVAIDLVLENKPVLVKHTPAMGCLIGQRRSATEVTQLTYCADIAPILQNRCVECHHAGDIGPMELDNYADVAAWSEMIMEVVSEKRMPPWHANPTVGHFANDRSLSEIELSMIQEWIRGGCPEGDKALLPAAKVYTTGWQLPREPDLVLDMRADPFAVNATGEIKYQYFTVDPKFTEDKWVQAAEIQPGNRSVVHHVLVFAKHPNQVRDLGGERSYLTGYVPGTRFKPYPDGMSKKVEAGSILIFQVHYTPIGTEQEDLSRIGFLFADPATITHEVKTTSVVQPRLQIPPGDSNWETSSILPEKLPDCELVCMSPHMHLRGKSFSYELLKPNGDRLPLLDVPKYDFNWQTAYEVSERMKIPAGSRVYCRAAFDNSDENPFNPDSSQTVRWGDQTDDEMMIGYFDIAVPVSHTADDGANDKSSQVDAEASFRFIEWDADANGQISKLELPQKHRKFFEMADTDGNLSLSLSELTAAMRKLSE